MAKTGDVLFTHNSTEYNYMLALNADKQKAWQVTQFYTNPPSLIKNQIDLTIKAGPNLRLADGTTTSTNMDIATVQSDLRTLTDSTTEITLDGYDGQTYNVLFDPTATRITAVFDDTRRIPQYDIGLRCYDRHQ